MAASLDVLAINSDKIKQQGACFYNPLDPY